MDAVLWPSDIAKLYGNPIEGAVPQQCVGIVALGGGYLLEDVNAAMAQANRPLPTIVESSADGTKNQFGGGTSADEEIALDMQVLAGIVPAPRSSFISRGTPQTALPPPFIRPCLTT